MLKKIVVNQILNFQDAISEMIITYVTNAKGRMRIKEKKAAEEKTESPAEPQRGSLQFYLTKKKKPRRR